MFENQPKTLSIKTNEEVSSAFDKLEARIKETDDSLTRGEVLAAVIAAAEKSLITEDNIKLATKEELRLIEQHTQRLKDIYLSIFKRSEDHQLLSKSTIKELEAKVTELRENLKNETEQLKSEIEFINLEKEELQKENEEVLEKSRVIENSFLDKERTIKGLEEKIEELEEVRIENRELAKENKELITRNSEAENEKLNLQNELKHQVSIKDRLEKETDEKGREIKDLNYKIQEIIGEKEKEKSLEIKALNQEYKEELDKLHSEGRKEIDKLHGEHRKETDGLKDEYNKQIQELNKKIASLEVELQMTKNVMESQEEKKNN